MAKRKRLTASIPQDQPLGSAPQSKGMFTQTPATPSVRTSGFVKHAPIADMAGAAAASAALEEVSAELSAARQEGRLVAKLSLDKIDASHLIRDRVLIDSDDMNALINSIRMRGQQTPIEVLETSPGHYGLISGWRRLSALHRLYSQKSDEKFATVQALIRTPASAQDAYIAMIEENEIRVGLSYFERAQIVVRTVQAGIYPNAKNALQTLFSNASRAKRSKIKSFLPIVEALGSTLKFPSAITERLGLELSQKLADENFSASLNVQLEEANLESQEAEQNLLLAALEASKGPIKKGSRSFAKAVPDKTVQYEVLAPNLQMTVSDDTLTLTGKAITPDLVDRIRTLLQT